ncbi:hypothetical protein CPC08DRAFT_743805 [Agrocybe pediades]|nr:hypothetical protein CPC08DRAFT_743805 [Agrocybe pediades]
MTTTYSSAQLRERDQHIHKQCQEQLRALEARHNRLKYLADDLRTQIFDEQNRGRRFAESLGFEDILDAQVTIDSSEYGLTYRECFERLQMLNAELEAEKKEAELARVKAEILEKEKRVVDLKLSELQKRYDDLLDVKERAAERYKLDYKKWKNYFNSTFSDDPDDRKVERQPGITPQERKKRETILQRKRARLTEGNFGASIEPWSPQRSPMPKGARRDANKENEGTPMPPSKRRRIDSENILSPSRNLGSPLKSGLPMQPLHNSLLKSVTNTTAPSSSPSVFLDKRDAQIRTPTPLQFQPIPIPDSIVIKEEPQSCTPSPLHVSRPNTPEQPPLSQSRIPGSGSSETEDDSQAIYVPGTDKRTGKPIMFAVPPPPARAGPSNHLNLTPTPAAPPPSNTIVAEPGTSKAPTLLQPSDRESTKIPRDDASDDEDGAAFLSAWKPRLKTFSSAAEKGKEREKDVFTDVSTPLTTRTMGQKRMEDYSAFKGRGRYGKVTEAQESTSINAVYTINPVQNGGVDYQYDEVVRNREARQKMDATDCECCREYYKSVGPLPSRLQQPLWKSPPATPVKPCLHHSRSHSLSPENMSRASEQAIINKAAAMGGGSRSVPRQSEIESHKKVISRHRHMWDRAATPPGYWDIGFPDTQEVGDINEKAREMHKKKKEIVDREAAKENGRYRRK